MLNLLSDILVDILVGTKMWTHLCKDGVHLTDIGKNIFARNILDYISYFILKEFWNEAAYNDDHFEDQKRDVYKGSHENILKSKQNLYPLSEIKN